MRLEIHSQGLVVEEAERDQMARKLDFALDRLSHRLGQVVVRLTDLNGPRGGEDLRCRIVAELVPTGGQVVVEDVAPHPAQAISRAASRLVRLVNRQSERRRGY